MTAETQKPNSSDELQISTDSNTNKETEKREVDNQLQSFKVYEHGITNGLLSIPPELFESFITYYYEEINRDQRITETKEEIGNLSGTFKVAREKRLELVKEELEKRGQHGSLILQANDLQNKINFWKEKLTRAKDIINELKESVKTDYSLFAAILFFLFAVLFIAADFGIALNIVADALKIGTTSDGTGNIDKGYIAYMFAIAIAGLAVVFKPAYDRLVEKPYHQVKNKKRFSWFIILTSLLVLAMLFSLGVFREQIISSGMMQGVSANTDIGATSTAIPAVAPDNLENSVWAKIGIISSTFLFSIAGAICLGISIPVIHKSYRITWSNMRQKFWNKKVLKLQEAKTAIECKRVSCEQEIKLVEEKIKDLQEDLDAKELIKDKKLLLEVFTSSKMQKLIEKSKAIYQDGYFRGMKVSGKVTEEWVNESVLSDNQYSGKTGEKALPPSQNTSLSRTRPFVAIRRMISQNFKNKVNKDSNIHFEYYDLDK